jgi:AsmA protein
MRIARILTLIVAVGVALVAAALLAVWLLVNPNDFKPRIAAAVKASTGRELVLSGDLKLSVFPWIALELGPGSLGNPPGFAAEPFLSFNHAAVRVRVWPLLAKRLDIGRVELDGLDVRLLKNAAGRGNWQGLGRTTVAPAAAAAPGHPSAGESLAGIASITVTQARLTYQDLTVENIQLETGAIASGSVVPVTLHLEAKRGNGDSASLEVRLDLSANSTDERLSLQALDLDGAVTLAGDPRAIKGRFVAPAVDVDLAKQTLSVPKFALTAAGADVGGTLDGTAILDAPAFAGNVTLSPLLLREFVPRFGITLPAMRDPKALSTVSATAYVDYGAKALRVDHLSMALDDTHLTGNTAVNLATHAVTFALGVDRIDVDRYLPPPQAAPARAAAPGPAPAPAALPVEPAPLNVEGTLSLSEVHAAPLDLSDVKVTLSAQDGVLHLHPLTAQIDGGQYAGDITLRYGGATPTLSLDEHLSGIDVGKLMAAQSKKLKLSGHGNLNLKATGEGVGADALLQSLNGHFDANVAGGALEGLDLGFELGQAEALLRHSAAPAQNTHRTAFDALKVSAEIVHGVATTRDLLISSAVLKVMGQGTANLASQALDLALVADTTIVGGTPLQIPATVTGTWADPTVRPDLAALAKGQLAEKAKDVLKSKLKDLFGKP